MPLLATTKRRPYHPLLTHRTTAFPIGGQLAKVRRICRFLTPNQNEQQDTHGDHQYAADPNQFTRHSMPPSSGSGLNRYALSLSARAMALSWALSVLFGFGVLDLLGTNPLRVIRLDSHAPARIDKRGRRFPRDFPARKRPSERILEPTAL